MQPYNRCKLHLNAGPDRAAGYLPACVQFPMKLGRNVLQELRMYFATSEGRLYFTAAKQAK